MLNNDVTGDLRDIDTPHIVPVDLNAFLEYNARVLSSFHVALGNLPKAAHYKFQAQQLLDGIEAVSCTDHFLRHKLLTTLYVLVSRTNSLFLIYTCLQTIQKQ